MILRTDNLKGHAHLVYLRSEDGITTKKAGHTHNIIFSQAREAVVDYDGVIIEEAVGGGWEFDGDHSHELIEIEERGVVEKEKEDSQHVVEVIEDYIKDRDREEVSREKGVDSEDMYCHQQWDEQVKREVEGKDRAAHTINTIETRIDTLTGYQKQNRTDFKYYPTENGDQIVADILNIVVKNITEGCFYPREESKVFEDTAIVGRGLFNLFEDYTKNIHGDIVIERFTWDDCYFGAHDKEDLSDCDRLEKTKWYSKEKIKELYPGKQLFSEYRFSGSGGPGEDWDKQLRKQELYNGNDYRVIEQEKKIYRRVYILVNVADEFVYNAQDLTESEVESVRKLLGFKKISRTVYQIRVRKVAGYTLLENELTEEEEFSVFPVYGKYRRNEFWGKVEGVKDLARLLNKAYSQFSDIINKTTNYGWFYDDTTFGSIGDEKNWLNNASSPGFTAKLANMKNKPEQVEGVKFPSELVNAIGLFSQTMRELMNVNLEMQQGGSQSGIAMRQKIVQQLLGNDFLFDNLSFTKKKLGQVIVRKIQKLYTPERLLRILGNQSQREDIELAGQKLSEYPPEALLELLKTEDLSKYDIIASESPSSPSAMMSNFLMLMELAGKGVAIPPQAIMEFAPIPQKNKIIQMITQSMEQQQANEERKYQTEISKSLIAQGQGVQGQQNPQGEF